MTDAEDSGALLFRLRGTNNLPASPSPQALLRQRPSWQFFLPSFNMCSSSTFCMLCSESWVREYRVLRTGEAPRGDRRPGGPRIADEKDKRWGLLWSVGVRVGFLSAEATSDGAMKGHCQEDTVSGPMVRRCQPRRAEVRVSQASRMAVQRP